MSSGWSRPMLLATLLFSDSCARSERQSQGAQRRKRRRAQNARRATKRNLQPNVTPSMRRIAIPPLSDQAISFLFRARSAVVKTARLNPSSRTRFDWPMRTSALSLKRLDAPSPTLWMSRPSTRTQKRRWRRSWRSVQKSSASPPIRTGRQWASTGSLGSTSRSRSSPAYRRPLEGRGDALDGCPQTIWGMALSGRYVKVDGYSHLGPRRTKTGLSSA